MRRARQIPPAGVTSRPAKPGETITVHGIGFGAVTPAVTFGQITAFQNTLAAPFEIDFGSAKAQTVYEGLAPQLMGLYQFNVVAPTVKSSLLLPLSSTLGGAPGMQILYIAVQGQ